MEPDATVSLTKRFFRRNSRGATIPISHSLPRRNCMSRMTNASRVLGPFLFSALLMTAPVALLAQSTHTITGQDAFTDYSKQKPGTMRKITVADLPVPYATQSVDNGPGVVPRPAGAMPEAPAGFKVELYSSDVKNPRLVRTAPNGDLFVVESEPDRSGDSGTVKV